MKKRQNDNNQPKLKIFLFILFFMLLFTLVFSFSPLSGTVSKYDFEKKFSVALGDTIFDWLLARDFFEEKNGINFHPDSWTRHEYHYAISEELKNKFPNESKQILAMLHPLTAIQVDAYVFLLIFIFWMINDFLKREDKTKHFVNWFFRVFIKGIVISLKSCSLLFRIFLCLIFIICFLWVAFCYVMELLGEFL